jgi:hypothetical protein
MDARRPEYQGRGSPKPVVGQFERWRGKLTAGQRGEMRDEMAVSATDPDRPGAVADQ